MAMQRRRRGRLHPREVSWSRLFWLVVVVTFCPPILASPSARSSFSSFTPTNKSLYDCLGVERTVTDRQLKKAYRKKALQCHPDKKGGDEAAFKELSRAYEILSDPNKRTVYDRYGEAGLDPAAGGGGGGFGGRQQQQQRGGPYPRDSFRFKADGQNIDPEEWFRRFAQQQQSSSSSSRYYQGGGGPGGSTFESFGGGGGGIDLESLLHQMMGGGGASFGGGQQQRQGGGAFGFGGFPQQQPQVFERPLHCTLEELAMGISKKIKLKMPDGRSRLLHVYLQKGWKAGTKIKYAATPAFPAVTLVVHEKPHATLQRRGNDLVYRVPHGHNMIKLVLPDGEVWERRLPPTLRKGESITISEKGMPIKGGPERGNLILEFL